MNMLISFIVSLLLYGLIIWIVGRLGLGLEVDGFVPAFLAALVIAVLNYIIIWLFHSTSLGATGWFGALVGLVVAALVLYTAGAWIKGMRVKGFVGALVGAIAIMVVAWLLNLIFPIFPTTV